jgi:hypothetical protein
VRVGRHLQALHTPRSQNLRDAFDERGGNPAPHPARIYEQVFQLEDATGLDPGGEADKRPFFFRDLSTAPGQPLRPQNQILRMGQQVVTVTRIRQRRAGIDIGCGDEVGGPARPDDCHGICPSRQRLRHQYDPPVIRVLDGDRAVLGPVGIVPLHRQMAERGQPGGNLLHLGQVGEIEHEQVVAAGRRTRAAVIMLGELQVVPRAGQPEQLPAHLLGDQRADLQGRHRGRHRPGPGQVQARRPDRPPPGGRPGGLSSLSAGNASSQRSWRHHQEEELSPKRRRRSYPRVVKRARHNSYRVKGPGDKGTRHRGPATIKLVNLCLHGLAA